MPAAVPVTATHALTNATLPYVLDIAQKGIDRALDDPGLAAGVVIADGKIVHPTLMSEIHHLRIDGEHEAIQ